MFAFLSRLGSVLSPLQLLFGGGTMQILSLPAIFRDPIDPWTGHSSLCATQASHAHIRERYNVSSLAGMPRTASET